MVIEMDFIFIGTKLRTEEAVQVPSDGTPYYWEVYRIDRMLKSTAQWYGEEFSSIYSVKNGSDGLPIRTQEGRTYILFARGQDSPLFGRPLMKVDTIIPLASDGSMDPLYGHYVSARWSAFNPKSAQDDPVARILSSPWIGQTVPSPFVWVYESHKWNP
jgi:hypothetical protein